MSKRVIAFCLALVVLNFALAFGQNVATDSGFHVNLVVRKGADWQSKKAMLNFERDRLILRASKGELSAQSIPYKEITVVQYTHESGRGSMSPATALAGNFFALGLMKPTQRHWLTIGASGIPTFLSLDKDNYKAVVAAFQANGVKVTGW
jgi:hypothetical protein